jgi:hypothetical protein
VQPLFKLVPLSVQLRTIRFHAIALEIDFSAVCRLRAGICAYWITFELHDGTRAIYVGAAGEDVSVCIRASRAAAYAKCDNAQANSREY